MYYTLRIEVDLPSFKQFPLNYTTLFKLRVHLSFKARLLPGATGDFFIHLTLLWVSML